MRGTAIIMAAGLSRRMGSDKLMMSFEKTPMYRHILDTVADCHFKEVVVVACDAEILAYAQKLGYTCVKNDAPSLGQGHSIELATKAAKESDFYMYFVADQPLLRREVIMELKGRFEDINRIIIPRYEGKNRNPVIFGAIYRPELENIEGDNGGKTVITNHPNEVVYVDFKGDYPDFRDVDTPEDYELLKEIEND